MRTRSIVGVRFVDVGVAAVIGFSAVLVAPTSVFALEGDTSGRSANAQDSALVGTPPSSVLANAIGTAAAPEIRDDYFAGIKVDRLTNTVTVFASDAERGKSLVAKGFASVPQYISEATTVQVHQAKYSRAQMEHGASVVMSSAGHPELKGVEIYSVVMRSDGAGLEVRTNDPQRANDRSVTIAGPGNPISLDDIKYVSGYPMHALSRTDPVSPYPGGIPYRNYFGDFGWQCTAAFGVRDSVRKYLLTAEHCIGADTVYEDLHSDPIGTGNRVDVPTDAGLISVDDSYQGVWVNDDLVYHVRATALSWDGELVCQSGYTSYPNRCQIEVVNEAVTWVDDLGKQRWGVEGKRCTGCPAAASGDSGGPVWSVYDGPGGGVIARGIVSAGGTPVPGGLEIILWTEVPIAAAALGVTVLT